MKKLLYTLLSACCMVFCTSCGTTAGMLGSNATSQSNVYSSGQKVGTAIKNLYTQYKADGKFDTGNINNLVNIAALATNYNTLKETDKSSAFYGDLIKGMIVGSSNLVKENTVDKVKDGIVSSLNGINIGTIINGAAQAVQNSEAANTIQTTAAEMSKISNSISNIFSIFQ